MSEINNVADTKELISIIEEAIDKLYKRDADLIKDINSYNIKYSH